MTDKLLPCPFCGDRLERVADFSTRNRDMYMHPAVDDHDATCIASNIRVTIYSGGTFAPSAENWNRRAPLNLGKGDGSGPVESGDT